MTRRSVFVMVTVAVLTGAIGVTIAEARRSGRSTGLNNATMGAEVKLGDGTVSSFARFDRKGTPLAIGVIFSSGAFQNLPTAHSDEHRCGDFDGDGTIQPEGECLGWHEHVLPLPPEASRRAEIPFKWVLVNWNNRGHAPPHIYGLPHFDIHYFMESIENTFALMPGPCGPEFLRCDQFERAVRPVPSNYMHRDFSNVDAAAPAMGNHLVDLSSPEFHGSVFDRTWIYGAYDGRITFYEEMVTRDFLTNRPNTCFPIKSVPAVEVAGYYPTQSCFRFDPRTNAQAVTMEGFVYREAEPPAQQ